MIGLASHPCFLGTLLVGSSVTFAQAHEPAVLNVQPRKVTPCDT